MDAFGVLDSLDDGYGDDDIANPGGTDTTVPDGTDTTIPDGTDTIVPGQDAEMLDIYLLDTATHGVSGPHAVVAKMTDGNITGYDAYAYS